MLTKNLCNEKKHYFYKPFFHFFCNAKRQDVKAKIIRKNKDSIVVVPIDAMYDTTTPSLKNGTYKISNEGIREFRRLATIDPLITRSQHGICDNFINMQALITDKNERFIDGIEISDDFIFYGIKMGYIKHKKEVKDDQS